MDDIHPGIRDDDRRSMTYVEIAAARGISRRLRWAPRRR